MVDVYLWLYHIDLFDEFIEILSPIKNDIILRLALCTDNDNTFIASKAASIFPNIYITYHPNAGGDILPFLTDFVENKHKQPLFIKLHSKKSHLLHTIQWRSILLNSLIGSNGGSFHLNLQQLCHNHNIGFLTHKFFIFRKQEHTNTKHINTLLSYFNISRNNLTHRYFPAGTMFWGRSNAYSNFLNDRFLDTFHPLLQQEVGKISDIHHGTYCHAIERIFGYLPESINYRASPTHNHLLRIINYQAPRHKLHLAIAYNNYVYIDENIIVNGELLHRTGSTFNIKWNHFDSNNIRHYTRLCNNTYIGQDYD